MAFQGKGTLLTTRLQKDSLAIEWVHITEVAQLLSQEVAHMYDISEVWSNNTWKEFMTKNKNKKDFIGSIIIYI